MFFYISDNCRFNLTQVEERLFLDEGWNCDNNIWYKGYSTECVLSKNLDDILMGYKPKGKWCVIHKEKIFHPVLRGFPLYYDEKFVTNIMGVGGKYIDFTIPTPRVIPNLTLNQAALMIGDVLYENIKNFLTYNNVDIRLIFTAGLDSTTVWSILDTITKNYQLEIYPNNPKRNTYVEYQSSLVEHVRTNHWGYEISRYYKKPNWLMTGFYAERFQMREVTNGDMICSFLNKDIFDIVKPDDYLYWFLKRPRVSETYNLKTELELKELCFEAIKTDHQGWHIDNNFQVSPFFDVLIPEIVFSMSLDDILLNLRTGIIQRKIIERFNKDFLCLVADYKNSLDVYENFRNNWDSIKLDAAVKVIQ